MNPEQDVLAPLSVDAERALIASRAKFVRFVERKVGDASTAEEIVQNALVRALEKGNAALDEDGVVNWFYRVLQNAIVDHFRRAAAEGRAVDRGADTSEIAAEDRELRSTVCACMHDLLPTLKPEYAQMVQRVDLDEQPVAEVAREAGITSNNASVRLHRARHALRSQLQRSCGACAAHGCLDCTCKTHRTAGN